MNNYIGIFDSGIGGFTILDELKKMLPNENFIYYKDSINNPYGEKSEEEIYTICTNIVNKLIDKNVKLIVIACNTATTICMKKLKEEYKNMIFVGTVPAIKVACDNNYKNILVMATPSTCKSKRIKELINDNIRKNQNIFVLPCKDLANSIENKLEEKTNVLLHEELDQYKDKNIDAIVLGCTHYPFVKDKIKSILPNTTIIDSALGVSKEVKRCLIVNNLLNDTKNIQKIEIIDTKKDAYNG